MASRLRAMATRPELAAMVADEELAGVWRSIVKGAQTAGPAGAADRMALARALGLPLHQLAAGKKEQAPAVVRDRLERGLHRSRSQPAVTRDDDEGDEPSETAEIAA